VSIYTDMKQVVQFNEIYYYSVECY
ncbi:MAG: hypothetical protein RLZZ549_480, partial [Pseudomonadota bacterium]